LIVIYFADLHLLKEKYIVMVIIEILEFVKIIIRSGY